MKKTEGKHRSKRAVGVQSNLPCYPVINPVRILLIQLKVWNIYLVSFLPSIKRLVHRSFFLVQTATRGQLSPCCSILPHTHTHTSPVLLLTPSSNYAKYITLFYTQKVCFLAQIGLFSSPSVHPQSISPLNFHEATNQLT